MPILISHRQKLVMIMTDLEIAVRIKGEFVLVSVDSKEPRNLALDSKSIRRTSCETRQKKNGGRDHVASKNRCALMRRMEVSELSLHPDLTSGPARSGIPEYLYVCQQNRRPLSPVPLGNPSKISPVAKPGAGLLTRSQRDLPQSEPRASLSWRSIDFSMG